MKILYSWLKDYIDLDLTPAQLADKLLALGIEVAEIQNTGADFEGVFAAQIEKIDKHPNADKLSLVTLKTKDGAQRVVCGAKNLVEGDIIPLAKVGARLGKNVLQPAQIRGVVSEGMICSADELGLAQNRQSGILTLDKNLQIGTDIKTLYGKPDTIFDLELTPNRPDLMSHLGVARDLSVLLDLPLKTPQIKEIAGQGATLKINLPAGQEGCPRYMGRTFKNVNNIESPQWLKDRLSAMGVNPKSALVDITNYVLYDIGHPLHAFDFDQLESGEINVRWADAGEAFTGLDDIERKLDAQTLVIADGKKSVALAGVLGGKPDSILPQTKNVFLESAYFYPPAINKTSKKLGISTEASQRFERGADIDGCQTAMALASKLISEICGGQASEVSDVYPVRYQAQEVIFTPEEINKILGMEIPREKLKQIFTRMSKDFNAAGGKWHFKAPSYRRDLNHKWDLAEEAARYYGLEALAQGQTDYSNATLYFAENPKSVDLGESLCNALAGLGFFECKNFDFLSAKDLAAFGFDKQNMVEIANPLNEDMVFMRPSLLPSLLKNIEYNQRQSRADLRLFEYGKTFGLQKGYPAESFVISGALCGLTPRVKFFAAEQKPVDFYYLKGVAAALLGGFDNISLRPSAAAPSYMHPKICADIICDGKTIGCLGKTHPAILKKYDIKTDVWAFEFTIKGLDKQFNAQVFKPAKEVGVYPASRRDLSVIIDGKTAYEQVESCLKKAGADNFTLIDLYQGKNLPEGKKSVTLRFEISSPEKTLTDKEITAFTDNILAALKRDLAAELR
ncbi:MAG: phenylalanine--tRNA ligase subunit beta [Elusimicrobiota bacterium]|jgi:phenylalanyl-tRNA synthetase beta chain|nr:phenylalanine--tRNA ligase subunit beta [Elusimicrobiota bacterium]